MFLGKACVEWDKIEKPNSILVSDKVSDDEDLEMI